MNRQPNGLMPWRDVPQYARVSRQCWRASGQPDLDDDDDPAPRDQYWVLLRSPQPIWWDWKLPSTHGADYYYQKLLLNVRPPLAQNARPPRRLGFPLSSCDTCADRSCRCPFATTARPLFFKFGEQMLPR